jgi:hypothetical protein
MNDLLWFIDESFTAQVIRNNPGKFAAVFVAVVALVVMVVA